MFKMNFEKHLSGSVVVGLLIIIDALVIISGNRTFINQIFSMFEMLWFFYSLFAAYQMHKAKCKAKAVPLSYVGYYFFSFIIANYWLAQAGSLDVLPLWYMVLAILFGLFYLFESLKQLKLIYKNKIKD